MTTTTKPIEAAKITAARATLIDLHERLFELTGLVDEAINYLDAGQMNTTLGTVVALEQPMKEADALTNAVLILLRRRS
ncbi:hypothetical protein GAY33_05345 [Azospirillum brasilense]|uniref:hypothetical protein n=1 Tax=Azospirillum argentinense TaxID=2970906 RepID=UPI00190926B7|nr:hypothetical protein [Azospirillum argentinense]MBK3798661.1 hypothetical protein [Azospirillum argentinense]